MRALEKTHEASLRRESFLSQATGLIAVGAGLLIGLGLASLIRTRRHRPWHSASAPSDYEDQAADEVRHILKEAGLPEDVINTIACGSWTAADVPVVSTPEQYHAYATAVTALEHMNGGSVGVVGFSAVQIAAALLERMREWESRQASSTNQK
jgi:hypothetical protein